MKRYYYKAKNNAGYLSVKTPLTDLTNYIEITEKEFKNAKPKNEPVIDENKRKIEGQIALLKSQLAKTDYQAIKYAEGWISEEEYAPIKANRQAIRDQINELEGKL
jgi:phage-related minor tail protein